MPSPGTTLRAPLLWLLLPFLAGVALADAWPPPPATLIAVAAAAAGLALIGMLAAGAERAVASALSHLALVAAGLGCGAVSLALHRPPTAGWEAAPREAVVTIEVDQLFASSPARKSWHGIGRIVAAGGPVAEARGRKVYFSAIKRISVPARRAGCYLARGVLQARQVASEPAGFDRYLDSRGLRLELARAQLLREVRPPAGLAGFFARVGQRFEVILRHGVERHEDAVAIYLGMLLGERAVLNAEQQDAFRHSGTFHIFVVAGLHVGVIAAAIHSLLLLLRVPRRARTIAGLGLLWL